MSDMREAGKRKVETQLPYLWNPHKIKKIRQDETEIQNINLGGTCRISPLWRKRLALAGRDMCRKIPHSVNSLPSLWLSQCTFWLMPSLSGQYFGYSFLKYAQIWKEEARQLHSNADTMMWTTSLTIWYRFTSTEISPPLVNKMQYFFTYWYLKYCSNIKADDFQFSIILAPLFSHCNNLNNEINTIIGLEMGLIWIYF